MDAKEKHFILKRIYQCWQISTYTYDANNILVDSAVWQDKNAHCACPTETEMNDIRTHLDTDGIPVFIGSIGKIYYMAFPDADILYVFGPIATNTLTSSELSNFEELHHVRIRHSDGIPIMEQKRAISVLILIYYMLTGKQLNEEDLIRQDNSMFHVRQEEVTLYHFHNDYHAKEHLPYMAEKDFLDQIENGTLQKKNPDFSLEALDMLEGVGTLARENSLKQLEYMVAAVISLASRAAMRGGVSPGDVYPVSELFFQKLAQARTEVDYLSLSQNAAFTFSELVRTFKEKRSKSNNYIEQCKEYIARHRNQKFSVQDVADALHLSRSYLSQLFKKECGITIQNYIMEQRLMFAENLLKFSDVKISEISDYLDFNSQSHFAEMFRRKNGITPSQYRKENQVADFLGKESDYR